MKCNFITFYYICDGDLKEYEIASSINSYLKGDGPPQILTEVSSEHQKRSIADPILGLMSGMEIALARIL